MFVFYNLLIVFYIFLNKCPFKQQNRATILKYSKNNFTLISFVG